MTEGKFATGEMGKGKNRGIEKKRGTRVPRFHSQSIFRFVAT
jgi:hypothetical protein